MNIPRVTRIVESVVEARDTKTFTFRFPGDVVPGQFFMIWIPDVDEIPMSVSILKGDIKGFTFRKVGEATSSLYKLKPGDRIGVRGPFGNGFKTEGSHLLFVGGGTGIATLAPAVEQASKQGIDTTVVLGVKNKKELFFEDRFRSYGVRVYVSTDDGSAGFKGLASELAKEVLEKEEDIDAVLTCGPERMMKELFDYCKDLSFQASLERYMKCSMGICGQCCIGNGLRVCVEGPVFDGEVLKNIEDFGVFRRDAAGRKILV
jgi:dihydroorotate dehydrogenase electron transfer subunit